MFDCSETNLKVRQAIPDTAHLKDDHNTFKDFNGRYRGSGNCKLLHTENVLSESTL